MKNIAFKLAILLVFTTMNCVAEDVFDITGEDSRGQHSNAQDSVDPALDIFGLQDEKKTNFSKTGKVIVMNKITSNSKEFSINVGSKAKYGNAEIELHKCAFTESSKALLLVTLRENLETSYSGSYVNTVFRGWIFASSPSLSAPEHPVYQLIAVSCS